MLRFRSSLLPCLNIKKTHLPQFYNNNFVFSCVRYSSSMSSSPPPTPPPYTQCLLFSDSARSFLQSNNLDTVDKLTAIPEEEVVKKLAGGGTTTQQLLDEFDVQLFDLFHTVCRIPENELKNFFFQSVEQGDSMAIRCLVASGRLIDVEYFENKNKDDDDSTATTTSSMKKLIVKSSNIDDIRLNEEDDDGRTALFMACLRGHIDCVKTLFELGADVDVPAKGGWTPLQVACEQGNKEIVELLLKLGARCDLPRTPESGILPIHVVAHQGHAFLIDSLMLSSSAHQQNSSSKDMTAFLNSPVTNYKTRETDNLTPLMIASQQGHPETVSMLIERGANPFSTRKSNDHSALMIAVDTNKPEVIEAILSSKFISSEHKRKMLHDIRETKTNLPVLEYAVVNKRVDAVRALCKFDEVVVASTANAVPLFEACQIGDAPIVFALLEAMKRYNKNPKNIKIDCNSFSIPEPGIPPLCIAVACKHYAVVHLMLRSAKDAILDVNFTVHGETNLNPLGIAVQNNDPQMIELLTDFGVDTEHKTKGGLTPLAMAVHMGLKDCVRTLLKAGASTKWELGEFTSLGQLALHKGHSEIFQLLTHHQKTDAEQKKEEWIKKKKMEKKMWQDEAIGIAPKKK